MLPEILKPVAVLIAWSLVMLVWLAAVRLPAMKRAGINLATMRGGKPGGLDGVLADKTQWPAHNYIHLMEQPTIFYAVAFLLAICGAGNGVNATIAWVYVGLRIVHSLIQATVNIVRFRFAVFAFSSIALLMLSVHALILVFDLKH